MGSEHQGNVKTNGTGKLWQLTDEKTWVIVKRCGWLPGVLCQATEFGSVELAELDRVSAIGWLERPGIRLKT
jgi:hypothetical protein